ncbi:MAG: hypothetical protein LH466_10690 [Sphingomonas bacterium]|nr:hypothetical protein [Sphingomonas bacterium]
MKAFVAVLPAMFLATTCFAQSLGEPAQAGVLNSAPYSSIRIFNQMNEGSVLLHSPHVTPTMHRQRLDRAVALRTEAQQLQQQNGGTLTSAQQRYLRRAAYKIMNGSL